MSLLPSVQTLLHSLYKCRHDKYTSRWPHLLLFVCKSGLDSHKILSCHVASLFLENESKFQGQDFWDKFVDSNALSWNDLIVDYTKHSEWDAAIFLYHRMQESYCMQIEPRTFVALLQACNHLKDFETGCLLSFEIARKGFLNGDLYIGSSLIHIFANFGFLSKAKELFDKMLIRNVVTWNALITGYVEHECNAEALSCYMQMQSDGFSANAATFICCLKACGSTEEIESGQCLHHDIVRVGYEGLCLVGNALVFMYAKYGFIPEAQSVFEDLVTQTEVSYTSLMSGFINHGKGHKALECFEKMEEKGMSKDAKAFVCSLKACINTLSIDKGRKLHMEVINMGLERNFIVGSVLVDMYGRCGLLVEACNIFEHLSDRDLISCATLISAYVENGHLEAALQFYDEMFAKGLPLGLVSLACMLRACSILKALAKGQEIHSFMIKIGFMEKECVISALFDMYAKCGMLREAQYVFAKMSDKSIVAWTSLIAGYTEQGHSIKAYQCFEQMQSECVYLNDSLFICVLKACAGIGDLCKSQLVHIDIEKRGLLEEDMCIGSSMIDAYAKCGSLASAQKVFDGLFVKNVVSWTALINGYTENGRNEDALFHYKLMEYEGVSPVLVTIICGLKACGALGLACKGQDLHIKAIKYGEDSELSFCHILIDMYARCGLLAEAQNVFEKSMVQDPVSCTALLTGYMEQGSFEEMLECLERLTSNGFLFLDLKIAMCILKACSKTGTIVIGSRIHAEGIRRGLDVDPMIGNIIVDMYAKCGGLAEALMVFDRLTVRNVISWTAMIAGYAEMGECENVILIFEKMLRENIEPDLITYVSVLNACSHAGLVEIGQMLFLSINHNHGLTPSAEHYVCMIDLFCRAGQITKGIVLLEDMPYDISHVAWQIVLGGCQKWGDVKLARHAFEQAIQLYELDAATYICMCNIFSNVGDLEQTFETIGVG